MLYQKVRGCVRGLGCVGLMWDWGKDTSGGKGGRGLAVTPQVEGKVVVVLALQLGCTPLPVAQHTQPTKLIR